MSLNDIAQRENSKIYGIIKLIVSKPMVIGALLLAVILLNVGLMIAQTTENKADGNLKSSQRVNPSTLAMEFSLPLGNYPGRNGNAIPITLDYSSKVWTTKYIGSRKFTSFVNEPTIHNEVIWASNIAAIFGKNSIAGWTSSLLPPMIMLDSLNDSFYNQDGEAYKFTTSIDSESEVANIGDEHCSLGNYIGDTTSTSCPSGRAQEFERRCCDNRNICYSTKVEICLPNNTPIDTDGGIGDPVHPSATPVPEIRHIVKRLQIQMPDGSSQEFRKDDKIYNCSTSSQDCLTSDQSLGTYLAVNGSGMRLERGELQEGGTIRDVLHLPDGGRYIFTPRNSVVSGARGLPANEYIDRNGNKTTYDPTAQKWTDTMGREIVDPLMNPLDYLRPAAGTSQIYSLKGINPNQNLSYSIEWKNLGDVLEPPLTQLKYIGDETCLGGADSPVSPSLFQKAPAVVDRVGNTRYIGKRRICSFNADVFNPVVMAKVTLPDGEKYDFKYNEYGEITKITYPTGGYERFEYGWIPVLSSDVDYVYHQTNRGVKKREISFDGTTIEQTWIYVVRLGSDSYGYYTVLTTAPDQSRTERDLYWSGDPRFGFDDPRSGMPEEERSYDTNGILRSRTLTKWIVADPRTGGDARATRDPRPEKKISIFFDPSNNQTLAMLSETGYDSNSEDKFFAHLNPKTTRSTHYITIGKTLAKDAEFGDLELLFNNAPTAEISETGYKYDVTYLKRGFTGLPEITKTLDPSNPNSNNPIAKTEIKYDEGAYSILDSGGTTGWSDPASDLLTQQCSNQTGQNCALLRGSATTTRTWVKETGGWLETHAQYDNFGNLRKAWGVDSTVYNDQNRFTETQYSSTYKYAYPTKVITPAPNAGTVSDFGTTETSTAETTYDPTTGLPLSMKNDAGQITKTEYDAYLRPWRVYADNYTAPETQTVYGAPDQNTGQVSAAQRFVKVRKQIDATNWNEATSWFDGFGRIVKTQTKDSQGDVFVETEYDDMGRVKRTSNPYRNSETIFWSKPRYDEAGRAVETYAPAPNGQTGASLGITSFDISTGPGLIGTVVVSADASGRKSRSITNALGQLLRVDEPTATGGAIDTDLGAIGSPNQATSYTYDVYGKMVKVQQGDQFRYFKYDSLGRLIRVNQPEQQFNSSLDLADTYNALGHWTARFEYDAVGNLWKTTDARGVTTTNTYDRANRVLTRTYSGEAAGQQTPMAIYTYDGVYYRQDGYRLTATGRAKGSLTQVRNGISTAQTTKYDALGRPTEYEQITDGQTYNSKYAYNFAGALETETYPFGRVVKNEFNADGNLLRISGKANPLETEKTYANSFAYTADGKITRLHLGNGLWEAAKFNERLQIKELGLGVGTENLNKWKVGYDYGEIEDNGTLTTAKNTGNIARQTVSFAGLTNPFVQSYKYDSLNRLTEAKEMSSSQQTWLQQYKYDRYGNRERAGSYQKIGNTVQAQNSLTFPTVNVGTNRFEDGQGYGYDKNGNLTSDPTDGSREFTFNGDNKQTEVRDANNVLVGKYFYDGDGKRVKKQLYDTSGQVKEVTVFVYSGGKLIQEYSTAPPPTNPTTNYVATDILQSVRAISNSLGEVTSRRDFMPFGEELIPDGANRTTNQQYSLTGDKVRQKFTGYQKDEETQLDFAEARMYNNSHGRFTAVDPLLASGKSANPQTFNRYAYVVNNPLAFTDPSGMQAGSPIGAINPTGNWYQPSDGGSPRYIKNGEPVPAHYESVTETNTWSNGTPVYRAAGLDDDHVIRLHPNGPRTPLPTVDVRNGQAGFEPISDFDRNGWEVIWSDRMVEPVVGVRNAIEAHDVAFAAMPFKFGAVGRGTTSSIEMSVTGGLEGSELRTASQFLSNVKPKEGFFDATLHGTADGSKVLLKNVGGAETVNHRAFATFLIRNGYEGGNIRLFSCWAGKSETGFAQNLANKLGVEVMAPDKPVWIWRNGSFSIPGGSFRTFTPSH